MGFAVALVVAAAGGFIALSYEILWYRVISYASWGLPGAFGLLLAAYLFGIAIGSRFAGLFCKDEKAAGDRRHLRTLATFAFVANLAAWLVVPAFGFSAKRWDWPPALIMVAIAAALLGALLPLVSHFGIEPDDRAGARTSYVYLANIVGSAAGSLLTGFVFLDRWPLQKTSAMVATAGMLLVLALVALAEGTRLWRGVAGALAIGSALVILTKTPVLYDRLWERLTFKDKFDEATTRFAEVIETKSGVITVTSSNIVYGGGAYDGKINTSLLYDNNGIQRAYNLGGMHPSPKRVLMIGLASGSWAKVVSTMPGLEKLTIVEINDGYLQLIGRHDEVKSILHDPKVEIAIDDGRRWLQRHSDRFDIVVMNTTFHWRAHSTSLLSSDFFEIVRAHLNPGGFLFFNSTSSTDVQKTGFTVFPHGMRVYNCIAVGDSPIVLDKDRFRRVLLEWKLDGDPVIDLDKPAGRQLLAEMLDYADSINRPPDDEGLESRESMLKKVETALVITDDNMVPEWRQVLRFPEAF